MPHLHVFPVSACRIKSLNVWESFHPGQSRSRWNTSAERAGSSDPGRGHFRGPDCGSRPRPTWLCRIHRGLFTAVTCLFLPGHSLSRLAGTPAGRRKGGRVSPVQGAGPGPALRRRLCPAGTALLPAASAAVMPLGRGPSCSGRATSVTGFGAVFRQRKGAGEGGSGPPGGAPSSGGRGREPMGAGAAVWQAGRPLPPPGGEPARRLSAASSAATGLTHAAILSPGSRSHAPRRGRSGARGAAADKAKMAGILAWFWNERFWLPHNVTWADLQSTEEAAFPQAEDLYLAFPLAFCIFMIRLLFER